MSVLIALGCGLLGGTGVGAGAVLWAQRENRERHRAIDTTAAVQAERRRCAGVAADVRRRHAAGSWGWRVAGEIGSAILTDPKVK